MRTARTDRALTSLAVALLAIALATALTRSSGHADTVGTPDTTATAAIAPATPNIATPGPITGVQEVTTGGVTTATTLNVHVVGPAGLFNGVQIARLCKSGLNVTTSAQLSPTQFGNCIAFPFVAGADDANVGPVFADVSKTFADFQFRIGEGTEATHPGPGSPITCDATNPCALWLWESVSTSVSPTGALFKHFDIQYVGFTGTTTTTSTTTTTTSTTSTTQPTTTTTSTTSTTTPTTSTSQPTTTTTTSPTTTSTTLPIYASTTTTAPTTLPIYSSTTTTQPTTTTAYYGTTTSTPDPPASVPPTVAGASETRSTRSAPLPRTGDESLRMLFSGTSLVGAGAVFVLAAQRRRRVSTRS